MCSARVVFVEVNGSQVLLFQIILGHENSEPRVTQTHVLSAFQGARDVTVLWITDRKGRCVHPEVLCLSQLVDTR